MQYSNKKVGENELKKALFVLLTVMLVLSLATAVYASNNDARKWASYEVDSGVVEPPMGYLMDWDTVYHSVPNPGPGQVFGSLLELLIAETDLTLADLGGLTAAQVRDEAHKLGFAYYVTEMEALTDQIWAVQVEAKPGESGVLTQNFEAAYGPYEGWLGDGPTAAFGGDEDEDEVHADAFGFRVDEDGYWVVATGDDYVGNYFNIDQTASTTDGITRRYISISSPWSHAYLYEDMEVVGMSEIVESFVMDNVLPGEAAVPDWWELF